MLGHDAGARLGAPGGRLPGGRMMLAARRGLTGYTVAALGADLSATRRMGRNSVDSGGTARAEELRALYEAALSIGGELGLGARLERVLDAAMGLSGALQARIALEDPETGDVEIVASRGLLVETVGMRQPRGSGLAGEVLRLNAPVRSDDLTTDERTWDRSLAEAGRSRSWLGVPL